jgi:DNA-directed RNA polymerase specialized sigma24 family protein
MRPEDFARFLEYLSPDMDEAGRRYIRLHDKLVNFFSLRGISDPANAADETVERARLKICAGADVPVVEAYCLGIARNVAKERWRREQKEHSVFPLFIESLANNSDEEVERIQRILKPCFEQLTKEDQAVLRAYCQELRGRPRAEHRRQLAEKMKTTMLGLRLRVTRLRSKLADCVRKHSEKS